MSETLLIIWLICGLLGWLVGASKGKGGLGLVLGFVLGLVGLLIILVIPSADAQAQRDRLPCPHCAERIMPTAKVCPHCGRDIARIASLEAGTAEGWFPDPSGRHPDRWWDGRAWTLWVRDMPGGTRSEDPPVLA